jgi:hypothetical protein
MNPFTSIPLQNLYEELIRDLKENPEFDINREVLHEFKSNHTSEIGIDKETEDFGIYLSFGYPKGYDSEIYYDELFRYWSIFIIPLQSYLESLFSQNTNNDACSFNISFISGHGSTSEEPYWDIKISISDYIS